MYTFIRLLIALVIGIFLFTITNEVSAKSIDELEEKNQELLVEIEFLLETIEELETQIADLEGMLSELADEKEDNDSYSFNENDIVYFSVAAQVEALENQYLEWEKEGVVESGENRKYVGLDSFLYEPKLKSGEHKLFYTGGDIEMANYYNYSYSNSKDTHQSFKLIDYLGNTVYFYGQRDISSTKNLIEDINDGDTSKYYVLLSENNNSESGIYYMASLVVYANPLMSD